MLQGASANYTVTVTPSGGFNSTVTLSATGLPVGATYVFNPPSVAGSGSSAMTVTMSPTTPAGSYTITVAGSSGSLTPTTTFTLVVNGPSPDFSITASPSSRTVVRSSSTTYTVTVQGINGFGGTVNFSVSGLPSRSSASFNPSSILGNGSSTMTVKTGRRTPSGTYPLTIKGVSGNLAHSVKVTLVVQ